MRVASSRLEWNETQPCKVNKLESRPELQVIDLGMIRKKLFDPGPSATKIREAFGIDCSLIGRRLEEEIFQRLGQTEKDPESYTRLTRDVYRAAVRAIGSSARSWSRYCAQEPRLEEVLCGFEPERVIKLDKDRTRGQILQLLGGQSATRDANAILSWAMRLNARPDEYRRLLQIRRSAIEVLGVECLKPADAEITALVAATIGMPSRYQEERWGQDIKTPGMRPVLASEFLRNLGWSGFKPDRHVERLLAGWFGIGEHDRQRAKKLMAPLALSGAPTLNFMMLAVLGIRTSPPGMQISRVDQLVWLYGAYFETKRSQSRMRRCT